MLPTYLGGVDDGGGDAGGGAESDGCCGGVEGDGGGVDSGGGTTTTFEEGGGSDGAGGGGGEIRLSASKLWARGRQRTCLLWMVLAAVWVRGRAACACSDNVGRHGLLTILALGPERAGIRGHPARVGRVASVPSSEDEQRDECYGCAHGSGRGGRCIT